MNKATEILLAGVPEPLRSELIRDNRATGRTTRLVDELVQDLMRTGEVLPPEAVTRERGQGVLQRVFNRVRAEHPALTVKWDGESVRLVAPETRSNAVRERLLAASGELGAGATGEQIADHAGVPRTSINYYFGSLAALRKEAVVC